MSDATSSPGPDWPGLGEMQDAFGRLGNEQLDSLGLFHDLQIAGQVLAQLELHRLGSQLDEDHPRRRGLEARLDYHQALTADLEARLEAASITVPPVAADATLVHGRVLDENERGLTGIMVSVEDDQGKPLGGVRTARTDGAGYYALEVSHDVLVRPGDMPDSFLTFRSMKGRVLQREDKPLELASGARLVQSAAFVRGSLQPVQPGARTAPGPPPRSRPGDAASWTVRGRVLDMAGQPLPGLLVRVFDKHRKYDDLLGDVQTDALGAFLIRYRRQDFREGLKMVADLYLLVSTQEGKALYTSENAIRFNAGVEEVFEVVLKPSDLRGKPAPKDPPSTPPRKRATGKRANDGEKA